MQPSVAANSIPLRSPDKVMKLARMGSFHQTRLSFMRALLRQLKADRWQFKRTVWRVDNQGVGVAVYVARGPERTYSLIAYAHDLPAEKRSDRVIAEQWDSTFTLFDGVPTQQDIERLRHHVPVQEAGQCSETELVLARANRSVRLFEHVVERLSSGQQPDIDAIESTGYLMRTTAVYGNGKFGLGDRERIAHRPEFVGAFRAELLAVWLIRWFTVDIAEHLARVRRPESAVVMDHDIRARIGVGNSTGLGMAPFLGTHPALLHSWIAARETALMRVRNLPIASADKIDSFQQFFRRAGLGIESWHTDNERQARAIERLKQDIGKLATVLETDLLGEHQPWDKLICWSEKHLSLEGQELLVSLVIEPYGELVDDLAQEMSIDEAPLVQIDGAMTVAEAREIIETHYAWALSIDFNTPEQTDRFWYVSEEKLEPRLGQRYQEPGAEKEQPLTFGRDVAALFAQLQQQEPGLLLARFLMRYPEFRNPIRRLQLVNRLPYAEIRDNLIAATVVPVDMLRCKLSFFGATRFDPRSDRWVRITMFQNAPFPDQFETVDPDDWVYPPL